MAALNVSLIEYVSKDNQTVYNIAVGNAELPICHSVGKEVKTCTSASDAVGASAMLCTLDLFYGLTNAELWSDAYSNAILLETLKPHISILPPSWTSSNSNANKDKGVRVRPSTPQAQILVQLRPGDQFIISSRRFSLTISEPDPVLFTPSISEHSTVVDLEEDEVDNTDINLPREDNANVDAASASASHPSLPGDEIDLLGSANVVAAEDRPMYSTETVDRFEQIGKEFSDENSPSKTAGQEQQNDVAREEDMQEQNGEPHAHDVSIIASNEGRPEQETALVELEAAKVPHKVVSAGNRTWFEGNQSDVEALPVAAISPKLARSGSETSPTPSETEATDSRTLLAPTITDDDKRLGNDADVSSILNQAQPKPMPEAEENQQIINEQPPETAQYPNMVQATEYHERHLIDRCITPSSPTIGRASSRQISNTILVADPGVEKTGEGDPGQPPIVLPQAEDEDTQTSTIIRIDELFHLAGVDSDLNNNGSSPGKVMATDVEAEPKEKDWVEPGTDLAAIGDGSMESGGDLDSPTPVSHRARGRPRAVQPSKLKKSLKRKLESPEKETSLRLKTPAKRRKTGDTESSMESTIEVRPRSSRRKVTTSSQTSKREVRGVSGLSTEPHFSSPSQRRAASQETRAGSYDGPPPHVLFSSNSTVDEKAHLMGFFTRQGGRQVKAVEDCTILCVGPGQLKKTSKLLLAVVLGKDIVRDKWLVDSARQRRLLDPVPYFAEDSDREAEWGTKLGDAIARGKAGTRPFADLAIYFTPTLKKELGTGFLELKEVALLGGATAVYARLPPKGAGSLANILILASSHDRDASTLAEAGWTCYGKNIISLSILQGRLNTESFRLDLQQLPTEVDSDRKRKKR